MMASSLDCVEKRIRRLERLVVGGYGFFFPQKSFLKKAGSHGEAPSGAFCKV
jgi:hypothetical protein